MHNPHIAQTCTPNRNYNQDCFTWKISLKEMMQLINGTQGGRAGEFKRNADPNELSKTKGSIPARLLSVSVQIWLHIRSTVLITGDNEINLCMP